MMCRTFFTGRGCRLLAQAAEGRIPSHPVTDLKWHGVAGVLFTALLLSALAPWQSQAAEGRLTINVADTDSQRLPCRVHLSDSQGKPVRGGGQPFWHDHFVINGETSLTLPAGTYSVLIERGPEYESVSEQVEVVDDDASELKVTLPRLANLRALGWYSGDMHVHRPLHEIEQLMIAEDLDFAPVITWWNSNNAWESRDVPQEWVRTFDGHRVYEIMAGEDEREGGALLYIGLSRPLDLDAKSREYPSPMHYVNRAHQQNRAVWIDIEKPFWWDVPTWIASEQMDSIGLANNHMCHREMLPNEAWGKPRDAKRLAPPLGNGYWTQEIYYQLLNAGIRIPPSAGSASGVLPNPVGYNRVYVKLDEPLTRESWFEGLRQGRCFVTNGPLLVATANQLDSGATLKLDQSGRRPIELTIQLVSKDPISAVEVIHNGRVVKVLPCEDVKRQELSATLDLDETGWFLIRAIADVDETFRFASTAPWYVETASGESRINAEACRFFLAWIEERIERIQLNVDDADEVSSILKPHQKAWDFWIQRLAIASDR